MFVASKFDPETDSARPVVGSIVKHGDRDFEIQHVEHVSRWDLVREILAKVEPTVLMAPRGYEACLEQPHPTRPFMSWLVRGRYVQSDNGASAATTIGGPV